MGAQGICLPDRAFRDRYLTLLQAAGIKPDQARWHALTGRSNILRYIPISPSLTTDPNT